MAHVLLLAPAGRQVGLTTACLGLVRALDRQGVRVARPRVAVRVHPRLDFAVRSIQPRVVQRVSRGESEQLEVARR